MKIFFDSSLFDQQLLRTISYTSTGGAEIGECLAAAQKIQEDDYDSWYQNWTELADRNLEIAEVSLENEHLISAQQAFLRASNYYRTAMCFRYGFPIDPLLLEAYQKHAETFSRATELLHYSVEAVRIHYEQTTLPAYFYKCTDSKQPTPTLIIQGGYETTQQESYLMVAVEALKRYYHVLCFDGPGQGEALIEQALPMTPHWENVITPIINYLQARPDVDPHKISLLGYDWGGLLAARAAAKEHRLAALIVNPGQIDALRGLQNNFPELSDLIANDKTHILEKYTTQALTNKTWAMRWKSRMWIHGIKAPSELFKEWSLYALSENDIKEINCPTFVADSNNEQFTTGQAVEFFDLLECKKQYHEFTSAEGTGEHCQAGSITLFLEQALDWLDEHVKNEIKQKNNLSKEYKATHTI